MYVRVWKVIKKKAIWYAKTRTNIIRRVQIEKEIEIDGQIIKLVGTVNGVSLYQREDGFGSTYIYTNNGEDLVGEISGGTDNNGDSYTSCFLKK